MVAAARIRYDGRQFLRGEPFDAKPEDVEGLVHMRWADVEENMKKSPMPALLLSQGSYASRDMLAQRPQAKRKTKRQYRRRDMTAK